MSEPNLQELGTANELHGQVAAAVRRAPIFAVIRSHDDSEARRQAELFHDGGLELLEVTFTVPSAIELTKELLARRGPSGPPFVGMGTVTTEERARAAIEAGAEFLVSPNCSRSVAGLALERGLFLVLGALTPTEIVDAWTLGSDIVKVYPLPPVGGTSYLEVARQPLGDIPMLAGGGFDIEEIPAYRNAGASAFGIGPPLLGKDREETLTRIERALELAGGHETPT